MFSLHVFQGYSTTYLRPSKTEPITFLSLWHSVLTLPKSWLVFSFSVLFGQKKLKILSKKLGTRHPLHRTLVLKYFKVNWKKKKGKGKNTSMLSTVNNTLPGSIIVFMCLTTLSDRSCQYVRYDGCVTIFFSGRTSGSGGGGSFF